MESINMRLYNKFNCDQLNNEVLFVKVKPPRIRAFVPRQR